MIGDGEMKARRTTLAITLLLLAGTATLAVPVVLAQTYAVAANAVDQDGNPLSVAVRWAFGATSATGTTPFNITGLSGELVLTAPLSHNQSYTLYIFEYWTVNETIYNTANIRFNVGSSKAIAHYARIFSVNKELRECYTIDGPTKVPYEPNAVPNGTRVHFVMRITVHTYRSVANIVVKDGIGADLVLDGWVNSTGDVGYVKPGKGKVGATVVTWNIRTMGEFSEHTLDLYVHTGLNPKDKQEYTSPGKHHLNDGPEAHLNHNMAEYTLNGPPIEITVV